MREVGDLIGSEGAAAAGMVRPAKHAGFEEGAVDDELAPAFEQVEQARFAVASVELVLLLYSHPRHTPALCGQRIALAGELLLLSQQVLASRKPFIVRHYLR